MKYPKMEWGTMEAVINKLGGEDGVRRFLSGELVLQVVARILAVVRGFNPVTFIGTGWKIIKSESDKRAELEIEQVDFTKVVLDTCLKQGEASITGEEKLKRLKDGNNILLGAETSLALWQEKDHITLEWFYEERGITYLDFFGTVLESPSGYRYVLFFYRAGSGWRWRYGWLGYAWRGRHFSVSLANK